MELGNGMVAVVRGLPEAALAVTLLEGNRQYTLMPNSVAQSSSPPASPATFECASAEVSVQDDRIPGALCHSAAQAVDGRYASVYKMTHCNVQPTSPPQQLTEFPPQRAEICRGQGNFEVGGCGSGETNFSPTRTHGVYRGAMNWTDRGAVCSPRPSLEPDAFAKSLRKYPAVSPERSAEVVERLINYSQAKNLKQQSRSEVQPRAESPAYQRRGCGNGSMRDGSGRARVPDESPTRDTTKKYNYETESFEYKRSLFSRNYDLRCFRDSNKRVVKDHLRNSTYPYGHPVCPSIKERYDHLPPERKLPEIVACSSVHMETQAEIPMISREVAALPRVHTRNVAVPLSPSSSHSESPILHGSGVKNKCSVKSIQTTKPLDLTLNRRKSVQTCISSVDLPRVKTKKIKTSRKSKSEEEIRINDDLENELLELIKDLSVCPDLDTEFGIRNELLRKLRKLHKTDRSDRVKIKFGRCIRDQLCSQIDYKNFTRELSKELISKIKRHNRFLSYKPLHGCRAEIGSCSNDEYSVDEVVREWLTEMPVKPLDFMGRHVNKDQVLNAVTNKIKLLITDNLRQACYSSLKAEIFDVIEDIPIEVNACHKMYYLNRKVNDLVDKIEYICSFHTTERKRWKRAVDLDKSMKNNLKKDSFICKHVQPTEDELKQFVKGELKEFAAKFHLKICPSTEEEIRVELIDILIDSIEAIRYGNEEQVKQEILILLTDLIEISQHEAKAFIKSLIFNFKDMYNELPTDNLNQTFIILQNSNNNASMQTQNNTNVSIEGITDQEIQNNLELYTQQLFQEINEWMTRIQDLAGIDTAFKQVVAHDLADDIVDRHKYLEINPNSKGSDADELEHLKYQIFKWVNKLVGEENSETIEQASDLMRRIQNIPVPMLTKLLQNIDTRLQQKSPNQKTDYQDGKRKQSSPGDSSSQKPDISRDTEIDNRRNRTQSSPSALSANAGTSKCTCSEQKQINNFEVSTNYNTTTSNLNQRGLSTSRKGAYTETDMPQISRNTQRAVSMITDPPKESLGTTNKRFSAPPRFSSGTNKSVFGNQTIAGPSYENGPTSPSAGQINSSSAGRPNIAATPSPTQLNEEYDEYVKNWVLRIPIHTTNAEEEALIDKMRLGIFNGIWKAITKIKMNPTALRSEFYYQDVLDDELEYLLGLLPSSSELDNKKQTLKSELVEKTTAMMQIIVNNSPSTFKQQLVDNVSNNFRQKDFNVDGLDVMKYLEQMKKAQLADDFILYTMYKENDIVKANVYRKKLTHDINEFIEALKQEYGRDLEIADYERHRIDIINALSKVPMPNDDTIKEEADEILLGLEIEEWFSDLPMHPAEDYVEMLTRRIYREALAKKVHDLEKENGDLENCELLKQNIMKFIERIPLKEGERQNSQFMCDLLINRLKNRPRDFMPGSEGRRKSVYFTEVHDYDEFSRDMGLCSSYIDPPDGRNPQLQGSSYMICGGVRRDASYPFRGEYVQNNRDTPESQQQWFSLLAPSSAQTGKTQVSTYSQTPVQYGDETWFNDSMARGQSQAHDPSFLQTVGEVNTGHLSQARHPSFRPTMGETSIMGGQSQTRDPSFRQTMAGASMMGGQSQAREPNFRRAMGGASMIGGQTQFRDPSFRQTMGGASMMAGQPQACDPNLCQTMGRASTMASQAQERHSILRQTSRGDSSMMAGQSQARDPSFCQTMGRASTMANQAQERHSILRQTSRGDSSVMAGQLQARDISLGRDQNIGQPMTEVSVQRSPNQETQASDDQAEVPIPKPFPGHQEPRSPRLSLTRRYSDRLDEEEGRCSKSCSPRRSPTTDDGPEGSTRPYDTNRGPDASPNQFAQSELSPCNFSTEPIGYSTPASPGLPHRESRPKKRGRGEIDQKRKDAARTRLDLDDSDDDDKEEVRCRCMERVWRCRRKRQQIYCDDFDMSYPCFPMRCPYTFYF